jgi:hypothetical protein
VIDIENEVFNTVATALRSEFTGIFVSGEAVAAPSTFPAATLVEMDDSVYARSMDSSATENHALKMYQAEAYSNLSSGKKSQCKSIMAVIDTEMLKLGFVRVGCGPMALPNADATKYRMVARYRAVISKEKRIYRR